MTTGVEMWVKIYSPTLRSIEVVQRAEKRARRARLYYMRSVFSIPLAPFDLASKEAGNTSMTTGGISGLIRLGAGNRNTIAAASRTLWKRTYRTDG